jgi:DNA mismatch repair protein MutS
VGENRQYQGSFRSILFAGEHGDTVPLESTAPSCFADLNLDQIVETLAQDREQYGLTPYFYTPLTSIDAITYRHDVLHDLDHDTVREYVNQFAVMMREMRERLTQAKKLHDARQQQFWLLNAHRTYQGAVLRLAERLDTDSLTSVGMSGFRDFLHAYVQGPDFTDLLNESSEVESALDAIRYNVQIDGSKVTVTDYSDDPDYSAEVEETFAKFRQGDVRSHLVKYNVYLDVNQVQANILALVAQLNPDTFQALDTYVRQHSNYLDPTITRFDREVQFYLAYSEYTMRLTDSGLSVCYPTVSDSKAVHASGIYDLVLAGRLVADQAEVITNDFALTGNERVIVVTGANQGGKTTFSRTFGQLHYLAALGLPVPGNDAALFLFDGLFTHYEKEEDIHTLHGKLEDELVRIHETLEKATSDSIIIMNEIFTSTTLEDAIDLGTAVLSQIIERDILCVCVTFVDELSTLSDTTVSLVAAVDPAEPASRTFKLVSKPADGLAYAVAIADKYGLSFERLKERIAS